MWKWENEEALKSMCPTKGPSPAALSRWAPGWDPHEQTHTVPSALPVGQRQRCHCCCYLVHHTQNFITSTSVVTVSKDYQTPVRWSRGYSVIRRSLSRTANLRSTAQSSPNALPVLNKSIARGCICSFMLGLRWRILADPLHQLHNCWNVCLAIFPHWLGQTWTYTMDSNLLLLWVTLKRQ